MPYGFRKRSRKTSRKVVRRYKGSRKGLYGLRRSVKALWRNAVERRLKDFAISRGVGVSNTWTWDSVVAIPLEGAAPNQGDGFRTDTNVVANYLTVMGNIKYKINDVDQNQSAGYRIVVVQDTQFQPFQVTPPNAVWQDDRFDSLIATGTRGRFSILFDRTYVNDDDKDISVVRFKVPLNKKIRYVGDNVAKGTIYFMMCGISAEAAGQVADLKVRLHYTT